MFTDTHCHIHEGGYQKFDPEEVYKHALSSDVAMLCVGTSEQSSREALEFAQTHDHTWAIVGVHPHDSKNGWKDIELLVARSHAKVVGIGEIGLDYFYDNAPRDKQIEALEAQLQLAVDHDLPVSFHVREAFSDFWPIYKNFSRNKPVRGVLHSFTDTLDTLETALSYGLYIGINGISTFARDKQSVFDAVPLERMLLETDAPFLTPVPFRGRVNEPAFVRNVAEYHANRRQVELDHLARVTSLNAHALFTRMK